MTLPFTATKDNFNPSRKTSSMLKISLRKLPFMESISSRTRSEILISQDDFSSAAAIEAAPTFEVIDKYILSNFQDSSERSLIDFNLTKAKAEQILNE